MKSRLFSILVGWSVAALLLLGVTGIASAATDEELADQSHEQVTNGLTVQLDADSDCGGSGGGCVGEAIPLSAGVWEVVVADNPDDHFDAWSLWAEGNTVACGSTCWVWQVRITGPGFEDTWIPTPVPGRWATQQEALAVNLGKSTTISLAAAATVCLWIQDSPCSDNRGGVTIVVRPREQEIPTASAWGLVALGLALLTGGKLAFRRARTPAAK